MSTKGIFPSLTNFVNKNLGLDAGNTTRPFDTSSNTPWNDSPGEDVFFPTSDIEGSRWDRVYPYRLLVVNVNEPTNPIVSGLDGGTADKIETSYFQSGSDYIISQNTIDNKWVCELPITPQQIQIVDQYAIENTPTARGINEQHSGVRYKMISINANVGVWAARPTTGAGISSPSVIGTIFGGTLSALGNLNNSIGRIKSAFTGEKLGSAQQIEPVEYAQTGYYQALYLSNFIERYTQEKKKPQNSGWRLVLDIPKMNVSYIVTPITLGITKSAQNPNDHTLALNLKAWKRIRINSNEKPVLATGFDLSPNVFQRVLNTIRETRRTLANATNLLKAVRSDFQTPLEALRQTALAVKDLAGVGFTAADLPKQIVSDYRSSISDSLKIIKNAFKRGAESQGGNTSLKYSSAFLKLEDQATKSAFIADGLQAQENAFEGLSLEAVQNGALGLDAAALSNLDPINQLYNSPEEFFDILDAVDIENLNLSVDQRTRIDDEIEFASLTNIDDLNRFKKTLLDTALLISNNYGAGDELYSFIYSKPEPKERVIPMSVEETEILTALFEAIEAYDILTASRYFDNLKITDSLQYVGDLASSAGIDFSQSEGKILVPVPFGLTIEQIAARYLKDPDKWLEIVTINKLRPPYIDEVGFVYDIISNASGRQINVDDSLEKIYLGQVLTLSSDSTPPFNRKVINKEKISDFNYLITLDGEDNLDSLTTLDNAKIKGYLPGTINSQNQIFIPSNGPIERQDLVNTPRQFDSDRLAKISKIDWLLDENGDVAVNDAGEIQLAGGLTNLIQALKIKVKTKKGSLLRHLDFGLGVTHGISLSDVESGEIMQSLTKMINDDPRFDGIERLNVRISGSTLSIELSVKIANGSGVLPIAFEV